MSDQERRELAAAEALGGLSPEELAALDDALADDPLLAREVEADREAIAALEARLPRQAPSEDLLERIMAEVERLESSPDAGALPAADTRPAGRRFGPLRAPRVAVAVAAAAAAVLLAAIVLSGDDLGEPDAVAPIAGAPEFPGVAGTAQLYEGGTLRVSLESGPPPPAGHHYEVWVLRNGVEVMDSVGEVGVDGKEHEYRLTANGTFAAVDISVEPNDGNPAHSGVTLAGGRFSS